MTASDPSTRSSPLVATLVAHYQELVGQLRRRFGEPGFAREVVHDACVQLIERPPVEPARSPLALLRRILHDLAVDRQRAEAARRRWLDADGDAEAQPCPAPGAFATVAAREELALLIQAIASLAPRCGLVFSMHYIHEIPQAEVARILAISPRTVEKHLRLGRQACQRALATVREPA